MTLDFCSASLVSPHWGEQIRFRPDNVLKVSMVFQGLDRGGAQAVWQPFLDALDADKEWKVEFSPLKIVSTSARDFWSPTLVKRLLGFIRRTTGLARPRPTCSGPATRARPGSSCTATTRPGCRRRCCRRPAERARRCAVRRQPASRPVAASQQGAGGRTARGRGRGPRHRR